jgi:hypothetical protein
MDDSSSLVEAKKLYTQQLIDILSPLLHEGLKSIFETCKNPENKKVLMTFQEKLKSIPIWNQTIIDKEYTRIIDKTDCNWLDKLIEAVFVSNVKVLSSVSIKTAKSINIKVPETKNFIHKCYIECARFFYEDPELIDDRELLLSISEIQKNMKRSLLGISNSIEKTIRELIPLQEILEHYLTQDLLDDESVMSDHLSEDPEIVGPISDEPEISNEQDNEQDNGVYNETSNGQDNRRDNENNEENTERIKSDIFMNELPEDSRQIHNEDSSYNNPEDLSYNNPEDSSYNPPQLHTSSGSEIHETPRHNSENNSEIRNIKISEGRNNQDQPFFSDSDSD